MSKKIIGAGKSAQVDQDYKVVIGVDEDSAQTFYLPEFGKNMSLKFLRGIGVVQQPGLTKSEREQAGQYAISMFMDYLDKVNPSLLEFVDETFDEPVEILGQVMDQWMEHGGFNPKARSSSGSAKTTQKQSKMTSNDDTDDQ